MGGARRGRSEHPQARGGGQLRSVTCRPRLAESADVVVEARSRGANGGRARQCHQAALALHGEARLEISASELAPGGWPGGRSVVDVIVRDPASGATLQWGWAGLDAPKAATLSGLRPNATVYREGETMSLVVRAAGDLAGLISASASATISAGCGPR